jgi:hypothetical protein
MLSIEFVIVREKCGGGNGKARFEPPRHKGTKVGISNFKFEISKGGVWGLNIEFSIERLGV